MMPLIALVVAYLVGGIPFGYLLVRWKTGEDVREQGSGNIGATNVLRTTGRSVAVATLLLDIAKGAFAVWIADKLSGASPLWMSFDALTVIAWRAISGVSEVSSRQGGSEFRRGVPLLAPDSDDRGAAGVRLGSGGDAADFDGIDC